MEEIEAVLLGTLFLFIYEHVDFKNVPLLTLLEPVILRKTYFGMEMEKKKRSSKIRAGFECLPCARHSLRSLIVISGA